MNTGLFKPKTWGNQFPEESACGDSVVRCFNCGIVRFHENPEELIPEGFDLFCIDCRRGQG